MEGDLSRYTCTLVVQLAVYMHVQCSYMITRANHISNLPLGMLMSLYSRIIVVSKMLKQTVIN